MGNWQRILVAVDETETSMRAVRYVGEIAGCTQGLEVNLLHIYPEPPPNYQQQGRTLDEYKAERAKIATQTFEKATNILTGYGIQLDNIKRTSKMTAGETISDAILHVRNDGGYGTVVVGKRGVSKAEEFLFGSISNTIVRSSSEFAVWVVS